MKKHNNLKVYDVSLKFMCEVLEVQVNYGISVSTETVDEARALLDDFEANMEDNH